MNLSGALAGLSASYPAYVKGRVSENDADISDIGLRDARRGELAKVAMGNALAMLSGNGQGMGMPQAPPPGQQSMPTGGGMPGPQAQMGPQGMPQGGPPPMPGGQPPMGGAPGGMPPGGAPQGPMMRPPMPGGPPGGMPQAPMPGPPQGGAPGGGLPQRGQGTMTWQSVMQAVQQSNPGIAPDVAAQAVSQFLPLMSQQSQMEWRLQSLALREEQIAARERMVTAQEEGKSTRLDKAEEGRTARTERVETGRTERTDRTETSKEQRAREAEQGRDTRSQATRDQRQQQFEQREKRLEQSLKLREDSTWARLEQQKQAAAQRVEQSQGKQGLAELRAIIDAQDKHVRTRIQAFSAQNTMKPAERKKMLDEADADYNAQINTMREKYGRSTPGGTTGAPAAGGKDQSQAASIPPEAVRELKEGEVTTFKNGQKWTLENGKPKQVP